MKIFRLLPLILASFVLLIYACEKNEGTSKFKLHLTDAPADYDSVLIDIQGVEIHFSSDDEGGWRTLENLNTGIYDLLKFCNGLDTLLASTDLPSGTISQIRLILGENNALFIDGEEFALKIPSGNTSGLKLNVHARLEAGVTYNMWIDFDAARSIVSAGASGKYNFKPVIRVYNEVTSGAIKGEVSPAEAAPYVFVISGSDTIGSIADATGFFMLNGVPEGTYTVKFEPVESFTKKAISNIGVEMGIVTDIVIVIIE